MNPPAFPAGPYDDPGPLTAKQRDTLIAELEELPDRFATTLATLPSGALDTAYRNWTIRQIVHHVADSHVNSYLRFKLALAESGPTIRPYDETVWASLPDSTGDVGAPLTMLRGVHAKWGQLLRSMSDADFARDFHHPEPDEMVSLDAALSQYTWHGRHHLGQIEWLAREHGWTSLEPDQPPGTRVHRPGEMGTQDMPRPVSLQAVVEEMDVMDDDWVAYINRHTGALITVVDDDDFGDAEEIVEADPDAFIELPSKFDIDEYSIMTAFCAANADPQLRDELLAATRGAGAFRRFKQIIRRTRTEEAWYAFRQEEFEALAASFLEVEGIPYHR